MLPVLIIASLLLLLGAASSSTQEPQPQRTPPPPGPPSRIWSVDVAKDGSATHDLKLFRVASSQTFNMSVRTRETITGPLPGNWFKHNNVDSICSSFDWVLIIKEGVLTGFRDVHGAPYNLPLPPCLANSVQLESRVVDSDDGKLPLIERDIEFVQKDNWIFIRWKANVGLRHPYTASRHSTTVSVFAEWHRLDAGEIQ